MNDPVDEEPIGCTVVIAIAIYILVGMLAALALVAVHLLEPFNR